ncbi:MAG TPA: 6,7-dimethyl-8-ribityllumazine synthase [Candidatus Aerophobetes bacterium]|uniref:6,7-dimethyl-8-ribityllumazine synthase n=1 Tax=Aerophobetes bacterium TaxID=2030807 RepID=A0A662DGU3_UNCAE|nr:MAG: 6,7-dimethyl-8-ribityllumazine synthase [Candidatus Aerophobetes bacterium]HDN84815.1 6,7-dimethyl-8-ribityllumazine synthase [Candidatus Aerophobetes bacterium]
MKVYKGKITAEGFKFGIVVSRYNEFITNKLLEGALDALKRHGAKEENIEIAWVPGSFEIPAVVSKMLNQKKFNAIICLGAVLRGATPHYELVSGQVARAISTLAAQADVPVIFGIVTADTLEQAIERAGTKLGNRGWDAAISAMEMIDLYSQIKG